MKLELQRRINKVKEAIVSADADACLITTSVNQFYLCGFIFDGYLLILPDKEPILFVKKPNNLTGERIENIRKPEQISDFFDKYKLTKLNRILVEIDVIPYSSTIRLQEALENPELVNVSQIMRSIRSIKSEFELQQIRENAEIHSKVYKQIPYIYHKGMTDITFQIELERLMRLNGSLGIFRSFGEKMDIYMGSILSGDNAQTASPFDYALGGKGLNPILPLGANGSTLKEGTTLMVDMAGNYRPWMDDMTRTFAVGNSVPDIAYKAHQISIDIHNQVIESTKAGTACADLYNLTIDIVKSNDLEPYFMGTTQQAKFIGHGVGLEINEPPVLSSRSNDILQEYMVIAVEPKFVLPSIGSVGIENTYIITNHGIEKVTLCEESMLTL
ncbi:MAG: Xaa-Pro peptidase family protein [Dysgonamonadaceae bacterium]